jgi:hypothetical protein
VGRLLALFCGCRLRRGFCDVFGAALGAFACMILSNSYFSIRNGPHQLLKDAIALGVIFLGCLGGGAEQRFVKRFGAKAASWTWIGAGIGAGVALPLGAILSYAPLDWQGLPRPSGEVLLEVLGGAIGLALIAACAAGWIAALAGAIREPA